MKKIEFSNNMNLIICPVCQKKYLKQRFKNHIINSAKAEGFIHLNDLLDFAKNKPYPFSPAILVFRAKHLRYYRNHLKNKRGKELLI